MAKTIEELKSLIDSAINTNGNRAITGKNLNIVLKETVDTVSSEIETSQSEVNTILDNLMGEVEELINQSSQQDDRLELHVNLGMGQYGPYLLPDYDRMDEYGALYQEWVQDRTRRFKLVIHDPNNIIKLDGAYEGYLDDYIVEKYTWYEDDDYLELLAYSLSFYFLAGGIEVQHLALDSTGLYWNLDQ